MERIAASLVVFEFVDGSILGESADVTSGVVEVTISCVELLAEVGVANCTQ